MSDINKRIKDARKARLERKLLTMGSWCQSRAMGKHDTETTLVMLERKVAKIRGQVDRAGWDVTRTEVAK